MSHQTGAGASAGMPEVIAPDVALTEFEESAPLALDEDVERWLRAEVNGGEGAEDRLELRYTREGEVRLKATQHVGVLALPDGTSIQVQPKVSSQNFLWWLRFAHGTEPDTFDERSPIRAGTTFIEALGLLFERELAQVIRTGLKREYTRVRDSERALRGKLDLQRQLQRKGPTATTFECTYDELTYDTTANQAILYVADVLLGLSSDPALKRGLQRHTRLLRRRVTLQPVRPSELHRVRVSRLNDHYEDLLRLTELILQSTFVHNLQTGSGRSFALLMDMHRIFEELVERTVLETVGSRTGWAVETQYTTKQLVQSPDHTVALRPDVVVFDPAGEIQLVADAKYKQGAPTSSDFQQIVSYQLAHEAAGALIYPEQDGTLASSCVVDDRYALRVIELPTATPAESYDAFATRLTTHVREELDTLLAERPN